MKKKNIFYLSICIIVMVIFSLIYYRNFAIEMNGIKLPHSDATYKTWFLFLGTCAFLVIAGLITKLIFTKKEENKLNNKIHKIYFVIALLLAILYMFVIPLFAQSDESAHYLRSYELSRGELITPTVSGSKVSKFNINVNNSIYMKGKGAAYKNYDDMLKIKDIKSNSSKKVKIRMPASNYSIVNYLPHSIGIKLGCILKLSPYYCGMIGRFFGLVFCISLFSIGIKILPKGKGFASLFLMSPVALSYSASFSADGTTFAYVFLLVSYILYLRNTEKILTWKDKIILTLLCIFVSISKIVYLPIIFILLLIPSKGFKTKKLNIMWKIFWIVLGILSSFIWMKINFIDVADIGRNRWIFSNPLKYLLIVINTTIQCGYNQLENIFAGNLLCHDQVTPFHIISFMFIIVSIIAFFSEEKNKKNKLWENILIVLIMLGVYILIYTAMYKANTKELANLIMGVQGRYLIPIVMLIILLPNKRIFDIDLKTLWIINLILNYFIILSMISVFVF